MTTVGAKQALSGLAEFPGRKSTRRSGVTDRFVKNCTLRSLRSPRAIALLASGNPIEWIQSFFGGPRDDVRKSISSFQYVCEGFYPATFTPPLVAVRNFFLVRSERNY
jgi:hypothetical protein